MSRTARNRQNYGLDLRKLKNFVEDSFANVGEIRKFCYYAFDPKHNAKSFIASLKHVDKFSVKSAHPIRLTLDNDQVINLDNSKDPMIALDIVNEINSKEDKFILICPDVRMNITYRRIFNDMYPSCSVYLAVWNKDSVDIDDLGLSIAKTIYFDDVIDTLKLDSYEDDIQPKNNKIPTAESLRNKRHQMKPGAAKLTVPYDDDDSFNHR